jgi:alkanesulfonate monooxygenase SsuD/methylene tetrahydromethanopterin reductase-like flavin-dependent oxidoreductase (luciferase family)
MQTPGLLLITGLAGGEIERATTFARMAEARGFRSFLVNEAASDALALTQHLASATSRIHVGTAICNIYLRPPLLAALQALTIDALAPGRLVLGLGTSHALLNQAYGLPMEKPLTALRLYINTMRAVFHGDHPGLGQLAALGLPVPRAARRLPLFLAGVSPKSIALTGEIADGSLPVHYGPHMLPEVVEGLAVGARRAGRAPHEVTLAPIVHCCVCPDRGVALRSVKHHLAFYAPMPFYHRLFARHGFGQEAERSRAAALSGDRAGAAAAISERMAEECALMGTPQDCVTQAEAFERAGASYVIVYPVAIEGDADRGVHAALEAFAR